jgi:hypothetical protein
MMMKSSIDDDDYDLTVLMMRGDDEYNGGRAGWVHCLIPFTSHACAALAYRALCYAAVYYAPTY